MALFSGSEYQIGRGETAESRVEAPFFFAFIMLALVGLLVLHLVYQNYILTLALALSLVIFGVTFLRVEIGVYILVVSMLLSPELNVGEMGMGNRSLNVRYDDILIIVVFLGVIVKQAYEGKGGFWKSSPVNLGIYLYYFVCVLSSLVATRRGLPLFEANIQATYFVLIKMLEFYMVFFLVGVAIREPAQMRKQLVCFFLVAAVVAVYALYSRAGAMERVSAPLEKGGTEPNTLGGYLVMVACLALALYTQAPRVRQRMLFLGAAALAGLPMLFTLSRASYIASIVGVAVVGVLGKKPIILIVAAGVLLASPFIMPEDVKERVVNTFLPAGKAVTVVGMDTGLKVDKSTHERLYVWSKVWFNFRWHPLLGGGVEWGRILDSQYARVIIETGLLGIVTFLLLQWRLIRTSFETYRWSGDWVGRAVGLAVCASTLALIAHSAGTISFLIVRIMEPFWFLAGLAVSARSRAIEQCALRESIPRSVDALDVVAADDAALNGEPTSVVSLTRDEDADPA
ncbi:MAG: hypothetical protein GY851_21355 [bacterium]|nr:hypothetical protein [bacterium]